MTGNSLKLLKVTTLQKKAKASRESADSVDMSRNGSRSKTVMEETKEMVRSSIAAVSAPQGVTNSTTPSGENSPPKSVPEEDAVSIELSESSPRSPQTSEAARERAEKLADKFKQTLNSSTALQFDVKLFERNQEGAGSLSAFRFKVVERETGRVIRQYPPEEIVSTDIEDSIVPRGLLVQTAA